MSKLFMPDNYVVFEPTNVEMNVASIIWGISIALAGFNLSKAVKQTWAIYKRTKGVNAYVVLIWLEMVANLAISVLSWLFIWGTIPASFGFFFVLLCFWVLQIQCILQILINRIALLVRNNRTISRMKWACITFIALINISVFCVWIPARLQVSPTFIQVNEIWDRIEKGLFCIVDAALNVYFIYLVHSKLIANGLQKYNRLFYYNVAMIFMSVSLDIILIGSMSIGKGFTYIQFHPLVYLMKLHIEMNMADLIAKIVRTDGNSYASGSGGHGQSTNERRGGLKMNTFVATVTKTVRDDRDKDGNQDYDGHGIQRTIETQVVRHDADNDAGSVSSSTAELKKQYNIV